MFVVVACVGCDQTTKVYAERSLPKSHARPAGDAFVASFTDDYYRRFINDWETRINHYLVHGTALLATGS
jgi:hypothetical protein